MQHAVWFVRIIFAAWMIPAGLNHFYPLFPQPMGNVPLSTEMITALIDTRLFTLVKATELVAGLMLLTGFYPRLALVLCAPLSFCVWWYDVPLDGWTSGAAWYGWAVLSCNVLLLLAYFRGYAPMFALRSTPRLPGAADAAPGIRPMEAQS